MNNFRLVKRTVLQLVRRYFAYCKLPISSIYLCGGGYFSRLLITGGYFTDNSCHNIRHVRSLLVLTMHVLALQSPRAAEFRKPRDCQKRLSNLPVID